MVLGTNILRYSRLPKLNEAQWDCTLHESRGCVIDFGTLTSHSRLRHPETGDSSHCSYLVCESPSVISNDAPQIITLFCNYPWPVCLRKILNVYLQSSNFTGGWELCLLYGIELLQRLWMKLPKDCSQILKTLIFQEVGSWTVFKASKIIFCTKYINFK